MITRVVLYLLCVSYTAIFEGKSIQKYIYKYQNLPKGTSEILK